MSNKQYEYNFHDLSYNCIYSTTSPSYIAMIYHESSIQILEKNNLLLEKSQNYTFERFIFNNKITPYDIIFHPFLDILTENSSDSKIRFYNFQQPKLSKKNCKFISHPFPIDKFTYRNDGNSLVFLAEDYLGCFDINKNKFLVFDRKNEIEKEKKISIAQNSENYFYFSNNNGIYIYDNYLNFLHYIFIDFYNSENSLYFKVKNNHILIVNNSNNVYLFDTRILGFAKIHKFSKKIKKCDFYKDFYIFHTDN